jgi:hypothetical protein
MRDTLRLANGKGQRLTIRDMLGPGESLETPSVELRAGRQLQPHVHRLEEAARRGLIVGLSPRPNARCFAYDFRGCSFASLTEAGHEFVRTQAPTTGERERAARQTEPQKQNGDQDYRPGAWFGKNLTPRLRMAAAKSRKTKRVRRKKIDGVWCYNVSDARQWWPSDVPKG